MAQIPQDRGSGRGVVCQEIFQVPPERLPIYERIMDDLSAVGIDLTNLGGGRYAVNGGPSELDGINSIDLLNQMLHAAIEKGSQVREEIQEQIALAIAKASAINYGQTLTNEEIVNLVDNLFACVAPNYTPDGKIVLATIKEEEIEKLFK